MNVKSAIENTGGLSKPSKMPCHGWSIPTKHCKTGSKLAKVAGTICSKCYATKGNYTFPNVRKALENRYQQMIYNPLWADSMVFLISRYCSKVGVFRWLDSGDIQGERHLKLICNIALNTPTIKHWLPTHEGSIVSQFIANGGVVPDNLIIRISANKIGDKPSNKHEHTSTVNYAESENNCPAYTQGGKCLDCRMCWNKEIENINYPLH